MMVNDLESERAGEPLSCTLTVKVWEAIWLMVVGQVKAPVVELMEAPEGTVPVREKLKVSLSGSEALAVKEIVLPASSVTEAGWFKVGARLTLLTVMGILKVTERFGVPLSVA